VAVGHEDVPVRCNRDIGGTVERIRPVACDSCGTQREQELAIARVLEHLMALAFPTARIGQPEKAISIHANAVREHKQPLAPRLQHSPLDVEFDYWRGLASESVETPLGIDRQARRLTPFDALQMGTPVLLEHVRGFGRETVNRAAEKREHDGDRCVTSHE
jgi:hypothetical protein